MPTINVNQKDNRGFQADLARRMGITRQAVCIYLSGKRTPGRRMAKKLEEATGIPRLSWMYPETYHNPLLPDRSTTDPRDATQNQEDNSWPRTT